MQKLNLINKNNSDITYEIIHFPDGEVHIKLGEINRKDEIIVTCRITNAEELFILLQVGDILNRQEVVWNLDIWYLMSMRMDRVISFNEAYSLKVVAALIKNVVKGWKRVVHPHSGKTLELLKAYNALHWHPNKDIFMDFQLCYPDAGAKERYEYFYENDKPVLVGKKIRNLDTGKIESITIENPEDYIEGSAVMVVDDLCDAGGTFLGIAEALRSIKDTMSIGISVIHMVNRKGIDNLSKVYNKVFFTNSYKDWEDLPNNCIMYDLNELINL